MHARAGKPSTLLCASWRLIPWTGWSSGPPLHKQALLAFRLGMAALAGTIRSTRLEDQECQYCDAQGVLTDQRTQLEGEAHVLDEGGLYEGLRQDHKRLFNMTCLNLAMFSRVCDLVSNGYYSNN